MDIIYIVGILIIVCCAINGFKKGFVNSMGSLLAGLLAVVFVFLINTWALEALLMTLLTDHMLVVVRVILCIVLYIALFSVLKAVIVSLRLLTKIPIIRGLNKLLGFAVGAVYGIFLVGVVYWIYSWFA